MTALLYYFATLTVFFFIFNIMTWGLNIQFGYTGILNFAFILFMAIGAYVTGVTSLGRPTIDSQQTYILGLGWFFPIPLLLGGVVAGLFGLLVGGVALKRLRSDYMAIVTVAVGSISYDIAGNYTPLFNGWDGISGIPAPLSDVLNVDPMTYQVLFIVLSGIVMLILWWVANRLQSSPFGRTLRSIREDLDVSEAFGKNTFRYRMIAMFIGCFYAGIAGGLLIEFVGAFNPSGWTAGETFVIWAALLVGGRGNNWGAMLGALLVPVIFLEVTRFLPQLPSNPALIAALRNIIVGSLLILVLWFRPQGILPERKPRFFELPLKTSSKKEGANVVSS